LAERGRIVLREGGPDDVLRYVDGVLLVDIWDELVLPGYVRLAWDPLIRTGDRRCDDWCRVVRFGSALTEFQVEVAQAFFALPASDGFLLAGGAALLAQQLTTRPTQDLDFFTSPRAGDMQQARTEFAAPRRRADR
jgi:hypothetical protein